MSLVQVDHLEQWGRTVAARDRLGRLLATLVSATLPLDALRDIRFLHGVATQLGGWDGRVDSQASNRYVPEGLSVWELGTGAGDKRKIREDFAKRADTPLPDGWTASETTYVGVTLAKLQDADELATDLASGSQWRDVRVVDAVALCHWLDLADSVDIWAYEEITGKSVEGIRSLSAAWRQWSSMTKPAMQTSLVTAAR